MSYLLRHLSYHANFNRQHYDLLKAAAAYDALYEDHPPSRRYSLNQFKVMKPLFAMQRGGVYAYHSLRSRSIRLSKVTSHLTGISEFIRSIKSQKQFHNAREMSKDPHLMASHRVIMPDLFAELARLSQVVNHISSHCARLATQWQVFPTLKQLILPSIENMANESLKAIEYLDILVHNEGLTPNGHQKMLDGNGTVSLRRIINSADTIARAPEIATLLDQSLTYQQSHSLGVLSQKLQQLMTTALAQADSNNQITLKDYGLPNVHTTYENMGIASSNQDKARLLKEYLQNILHTLKSGVDDFLDLKLSNNSEQGSPRYES